MNLPREGNEVAGGEAAAGSALVGGRFRIERPIGRGGMASVYEAVDVTSGKRLALKRLHPIEDARKNRRAVQLFEREFHTLVHLAHPRVVAVHDYGRDELGPHYTMELLDGGDLQQLAPLDWRRACALTRDLCSALSLLHSRRMVHRDLGPRNVRCTSDGLAKLIDFGAMMVMGPSRQVVGTPAYCAPEAVNLQALDQRTDLYSLGATLYYTLTGRHAYPAKNFAQLRDQWRSRPVRPSAFRLEIPPALDALVFDLMHLDPAARPANAAEVIERLAAIEGCVPDESLLVQQSYLSTPNLVGRETPLGRARAKTMRAIRGRGGAMMIEGASGVGRSRFLDACILEGKLLGALVLRADLADATGDYGVVRALAAQLLDAIPDVALKTAQPNLAVLGHAVPDLLVRSERVELQADGAADQVRARVQQALREWLLEVSRQRPLMVAVDDVQSVDEPSAAFRALLAHDVRRRSVIVAVSAETGSVATSQSALKLLADESTRIKLDDLNADNTEKLLRSVFGDVPHVQFVAHKLHAISNGNPRDVMLLAQHLLDKNVVRYSAGAWTLPASIDAGDLPSSMAQALRVRADALSPAARTIGRVMSLCPERGMTLEECAAMGDDAAQPARALSALDELVEAQVVALVGESYVLARRGFLPALQSGMDEATARKLHLKLAQVFERRGEERFRVAQHLLRAGETERGLDALIAHAEESQRVTDENADAYFKLVESMPADWFECYEQAILLCETLGRPRRHVFTLQSRLSGLVSVMGILDHTHLSNLIAQLCRESGLTDHAALDPSMESMPRLVKALELTQERYAKGSDHERVLEPILAIRQLARAVLQAVGVVATSLDHGLRSSLPSLSPLEPLSPALAVVGMLVRGNIARTTARVEQCRAEYDRLLERAGQPDRAGLDESHHRYTSFGVKCGLGMVEAGMGLASSLRWANEIESDPLHQVNALLIRMVHHLFQGDLREADRCKDRVELLRLQNTPRQWFEGTHLLGQAVACACADDLTRMKQTLEEIGVLAQRFPGWVPVRHYASGEYHRIRGDHLAALSEFEAALSLTKPGEHQLWPNVAGAHTRALLELGRADESRERARAYLDAAESAGLGFTSNYVRMPLALAEAKLGDADAAVMHAETAIAAFDGAGSKGLLLALAYETRARVAVELQQPAEFSKYAGLCAEQLRAGSSRVLSAKYEKLKQVAMRAEFDAAPELGDAYQSEQLTAAQLTSMLEACRGTAERAQRCLAILLRHCNVSDGFLYTLGDDGPELVARIGSHEPPANLAKTVRDYLDTELRDQDLRTATTMGAALESSPLASELTGTQGERYRLVLLAHQLSGAFAIAGVAVALVKPGKRFVYPGAVAAELSRIIVESGDAVPATVGGA